MRTKKFIQYTSAVFLFGTAMIPMSFALDTGALGQSTDLIQRQVEQRAEQMVERAMEERVERALEPSLPEVNEMLDGLPDRLPILDKTGNEAFVDVKVENGFRAVEQQWLIILDESDVSLLKRPGIRILKQSRLSELGLNLVLFKVDASLDSRDALERILPEPLAEYLDRNHIFSPQSDASSGDRHSSNRNIKPLCESPLTVGMIDTAIQSDHQSLAHASIVQKHFLSDMELAEPFNEPKGHGTAVASLMIGKQPDNAPTPLIGAKLVNASVFYGRRQLASGATLLHFLQGLDWLVSHNVGVINVSMAGPDNRLLAAAIKKLISDDQLIVAAVGNDGPAAPALYPAAYPGVIGVTAVDKNHQVYRWANRGKHVDFAALGVDVRVADSDGDFKTESGTSMAAPLVTAQIACQAKHFPAGIDGLMDELTKQAIDLGEPGRDSIFGYGALRLEQ